MTTTGNYLKEELELAINGLNGIVEHAKLIAKGNMGSLKLGYVGSAMQNVIPDLLKRFNAVFPAIHFSLHEFDNNKKLKLSQLGRLI